MKTAICFAMTSRRLRGGFAAASRRLRGGFAIKGKNFALICIAFKSKDTSKINIFCFASNSNKLAKKEKKKNNT